MKGLERWRNETVGLAGLGRGGVSVCKKNQAESCKFSQPL